MKPKVSPYSKMYLVTPAVYEKLLLCLDEGDKRVIDNLNRPEVMQEEKRPSETFLDDLSGREVMGEPLGSELLPESRMSPEEISQQHQLPVVSQPEVHIQPQRVRELQSEIHGLESPMMVEPSYVIAGKRKRADSAFTQRKKFASTQPLLEPQIISPTDADFASQSVRPSQTPVSSIPKRVPIYSQPSAPIVGASQPCIVTRAGKICVKNLKNIVPSRQRKQCHLCTKWFGRQYNLDRHLQDIHGIQPQQQPESIYDNPQPGPSTQFENWGAQDPEMEVITSRKRVIPAEELLQDTPSKNIRIPYKKKFENWN